eukprot:TRINITY_DN546_c0_g1_i2.p1 TRINITY_DN546_c0_g1~~TRINITY_DN546_c0_g1_i2.p1  ORF type:complete len:181 (-),score=30.91 TRINITY_DN546_c0_g1_i2:260-745(-)
MARAAIPSMAPHCAFVVGLPPSTRLPASQRRLRVATHARRPSVPSGAMRRWAARMATSASSPSSAGGVYYQRILQKLTEGLSPSHVELVDESDQHAGHAGNPGTGETHFRLSVTSDAFEGVSRVGRHRKVYGLLADELSERVHALSITTQTPAEAARTGAP